MDADGANQVRIYTDIINFPLCCDHHYSNPAWQPVPQVPNTYIISGRITDNNNAGVSGAVVNLSGTTNASTTTDHSGNYSFSALAPGGNYTVSPSMLARRFLPPNRTFTNLSSNQVGNFTVSRICIGVLCAQNGKIAFTRSGEIWTMNADGSNQSNITNNPAFDGGADWSPDGVKIAFISNRDGNDEIYRKNSEDDLNPTRLTNNAASDSSPRHSPDGASIVFVSNRDGNNEIYKMNADGSNQVRLTNSTDHDSSASFSPDGRKILWVRQHATSPFGFSLFTMNPDGSNQLPLSGPHNFAVSPSYSPDGTKILLVWGSDVTQQTIYTMNADGTGLAQSGIGRSQPAWSPDGTKVVHNCCFFQGPQFSNGLFVSNLAGPLGQRMTSDGNNESSPDWQPIPVQRRTAFDYDGDSRADISFFRGEGGFWWQARSTGPVVAPQWGIATDVLTPADYDGDLKTDIAVWRESDATFYALNSFDLTVRIEQFGITGDIPTGGDFDGDGKADIAVYRSGAQSFFYYRASMGNPQKDITFVPWGTTGDKPVVGDFDGDARTDVGVFRPSANTWYVRKSGDGQLLAAYFGAATDLLVPADYDGDGKTDIAVFRQGIWYLLRSALGFGEFQWGTDKDIPAPADYDGDGKADATIYRQGTWWILKSQTGTAEGHPFGGAGDKPIPSAYVR
jgi:Tol biopolymer transport system component